jgi:hypothetical protein
LQPRPRNEVELEITYSYDVDGILHVLVRDRRSGAVLIDQRLLYGSRVEEDELVRMRQRVAALMPG